MVINHITLMYCWWWYYRALHIIIICTFTMWHTLVKSSLPPNNDQNHQRAYKMLLVRFCWVMQLESVQSCLIMFLWHYWFQGGADDLLIFFFIGEKVVFSDTDVSIPTSLSLNGRIFISLKDHLDALVSTYYL